MTNSATGVTNGLFTITLDFGAGVFSAGNRWLEVGVRTNGNSAFSALVPRQKITPTPYALYAAGAGTAASAGAVAAGNIVGTLTTAQLPASVPLLGSNVTFGAISGAGFAGNGAGLTNVPLLQLNSLGAVASFFSIPFGFSFAGAPATPVRSTSFILADVRGNSRLDLICAEGLYVEVLTNDGAGTFTPATTNLVGNYPDSIVAADVNGDGRVDLITANYVDNTVSVLTNRGDGTFTLAVSPAVGVGPNAITAADVNGDGRMDLITGNYGLVDTNLLGTGRTLTVLTNAGNTSFLLAGSPDVGAASYTVVATDVNGDGRVDLISLNGDVEELVVLTNAGLGTFVMASTNAVTGGSDVVAADVNGDGRVDLLVSSLDGLVFVLTNSGGGTFAVAGTPPVGNLAFSVAVADVNNDGRPDLICPSYYANTLVILTNDGTATFFPADTNGVPAKPYWVAAADINGDGWVDLINSHLSTNIFTVLTNGPRGRVIQFTGQFAGDGAGLTNFHINASDLTSGMVADALLSTNVALLDADQMFFGMNHFINPDNSFAGVFSGIYYGSFEGSMVAGDGSALTALNASQLASGTVADLRLTPNVALLNRNQSFSGVNALTNQGNSFAGNGAGLTNLGPASLTTGTYAISISGSAASATTAASAAGFSGALSGDVTGAQSATAVATVGGQTAASVANATAAANAATAANTSGTIVRRDPSGNFSAGAVTVTSVTGNGSGLSGLNAANVTGGTLADARLSANVALLSTNQTFAGTNTFAGTIQVTGAGGFAESSLGTFSIDAPGSAGGRFRVQTSGNVGIGTNSPAATLDVNGTSRIRGANNWDVTTTEGDFRVGNDVQRFKIGVATGGGGAGDVWMRAQGGTQRVFLKTPGGTTIYSDEAQSAGVSLAAGGGAWATLSDRNAKENFAPVDRREVLEKVVSLPLSTWNYKSEAAVFRHLGPMAQDFKAAFGLGETDTGITTVDADGVALAAIQGLNEKVEVGNQKSKNRTQMLEAKLQQKEKEITELKQRLDALEKIILNQKPN